MNLLPHQRDLVDKNPERHGIFHATGSGKSFLGLALAEKNCKTCLIIVPKMLVRKWERDIVEHGKNCAYTIISKETFRRDATILPRYDGVIVDEFHFFLGIKSQLSKRLYGYLKKHDIKYRWFMTATPYLSSVWNIYVAARLLGHDWNYSAIKNEFFYEIRMGHRMIPVQKQNIETRVAQLVQEIGSVVDLDTALSMAKEENHDFAKSMPDKIPEQTFQTEYFPLTPQQDEAIKLLDDVEFITRFVHIHLIENGLLYSDGYTEDREFPCLKTERILQLVKENNKIAIICRYNGQIEYLKRQLKHLNRPVFVINGENKDRDTTIKEANEAQNAIVFIQSACSAGYELPTFNTIVFASLSFALVDHQQILGRFLRINALSANRYIYLVAHGYDEDIYDCIMAKKDFSIAIYSKEHATIN